MDDGVIRSVTPIFGFEEGAAIVDSDQWTQVTKTLFSRLEGLTPLPPIPNTTREIYLGFRYSDELTNCAPEDASLWRFYYPWKDRPGHRFSVYRSWTGTNQGQVRWVKVPSIKDQALAAGADVTGHGSWGYWSLEARTPQECIDIGRGKLRVFGIWAMVVDRQNGTTASVTLDTETGRGIAGTYSLGGLDGTVYVDEQHDNVGIGTSATAADRLSVDGTVRAKEIIVTDTGWADYVFADTYTPMPLDDLRMFISQNRHLPGIPTADEVATHGVELGHNQTQLLAKIEELTLYTLDQQGEISAQRARLNTQDARIRRLEETIEGQKRDIETLLRSMGRRK